MHWTLRDEGEQWRVPAQGSRVGPTDKIIWVPHGNPFRDPSLISGWDPCGLPGGQPVGYPPGTRTRDPCGPRGQNLTGPTRVSRAGPELDFGLGPLRVYPLGNLRVTRRVPAHGPRVGPADKISRVPRGYPVRDPDT